MWVGGVREEMDWGSGREGKDAGVRVCALMQTAAGYHAVAAGNVGTSLADVVTEAEPYEVVAVELSSFQLHWSSTIEPFAAVVLNVAAHHLDWHGSLEAYAADQARIVAPRTIAIGTADDERSARIVADARARPAGPLPAGTREAGTALYRLREPGPRE